MEKQNGSGGRLRLGFLTAAVAAFLLVPVAAASAAFTVTVVPEGSGSGTVENSGHTGPVAQGEEYTCHWNGHEIDSDIDKNPGNGICEGETFNEGFGEFFGAFRHPDAGSEIPDPWTVEGGSPAIECGAGQEFCAGTASGPVTVHAPFKAEPTAPSNVTPPTISGTAKVGKTLKGNAGTWSGEPTSFTYQWLRCDELGTSCTPITGAESTEYTVTEEDTESTLRFEETAKNGLGEASATSAQTAVVPKAGGSGEASKTGEVYGEVEQETSLESSCSEVFLGFFKAGVEKDYEESCTVVATSTGAESTLSAADENATAPGYLVNGTYSLAQLLQVQGTDTESLGGASTGFQTVASPSALLSWAVPVSADTVQVDFKQPIGKHDPLHTGTYSKVITLTLQQTTP